jgi:hypothetical protein
MNGIRSSGVYFGLIHVFPKNFKKSAYVVTCVLLVESLWFDSAIVPFTWSGSKRLHCLANARSVLPLEINVSSALPFFFDSHRYSIIFAFAIESATSSCLSAVLN